MVTALQKAMQFLFLSETSTFALHPQKQRRLNINFEIGKAVSGETL